MSNSDREPSSESRAPDEAPRRRSEVMEYFGRLAPVYGEGEYYRNRRAAVIAAIAPELAHAKSILDLGCGPGVYSAELRSIARDARMVAADLTFDMLLAVQQRNLKKVNLVRCDLWSLPFLRGTWDLIFCSHVLPFVGDLDRCILEIADSLAPDGLLIATFGRSGVRERLRERIADEQWRRFDAITFRARQLSSYAAERDQNRYRDAYATAGLTCEARDVPFELSWPGVEEWIALRWFTMIGDADRAEAEKILKAARPLDYASARLTFNEPLLIGRKP
jgi:SAM-dependent methyltransferase